MPLPTFTTDDFLGALLALLPRGRVWSGQDPDTVQYQALRGIVAWLGRDSAAANALLIGAFPATAGDMLPEWEAALGLPDPCVTQTQTLAERQKTVATRLAGRGGQSVSYILGQIVQEGFPTPTITQYAPARAGFLRAGQPDYGQDWAFAWTLSIGAQIASKFVAGASAAGEPLADYQVPQLECLLNRISPAHTYYHIGLHAPLGAMVLGYNTLG